MRFAGNYHFIAPTEQVFGALTDPVQLQQAIDVCDRIEPKGNDVYEVHAQIQALGMRVKPVILVTIANRQPPRSCQFQVTATSQYGNLAGNIQIRIQPNASGSLLGYDVEGTISGLLSAVAPRLIEVNVQRALTQFFEKLDRQIAPAAA